MASIFPGPSFHTQERLVKPSMSAHKQFRPCTKMHVCASFRPNNLTDCQQRSHYTCLPHHQIPGTKCLAAGIPAVDARVTQCCACIRPKTPTLCFCSSSQALQACRKPLRYVTRASNQQSGMQPHQPAGTLAIEEVDFNSYRRNVGLCVFNQHGQVFAAQRCDDKENTWQMPQGGVEDGEDLHEAALRELVEETGIRSVRIVDEVPGWLTYHNNIRMRCHVSGGWKTYKGQAQKWLLLYFDGDESEVNLDTEHKEFKAWRWMALEELPGSVVHFKQDVYQAVAASFGPRIRQMVQQQELQ